MTVIRSPEHRFDVRARRSAAAIPVLSAAAWLLFSSAQIFARVPPGDHRHVDSWMLTTLLLVGSWLVALILDYNIMREQRARSRQMVLP